MMQMVTFFVKSITIYNADESNPFKEIPENVSQLTYKLNLIDKKIAAERMKKGVL